MMTKRRSDVNASFYKKNNEARRELINKKAKNSEKESRGNRL